MISTETSIYEYARQNLASGKDRVALRYYGGTVTYGRLFEMIDNVADHLARLGVGLGTVVSIHLPNCPQAVMAVYAVAKLGGICGMVHPQMPAAALGDYMRQTGSKVLITSDIFPGLDQADFAEVLIVARLAAHFGPIQKMAFALRGKRDIPSRAIPFESMERPCPVKPDYLPGGSLADKCVCYLHSSGTTGKPKIVMHSHAVFNRYVANTQAFLGDYDFSKSVTATTLPMFHAAGLLLIFHQFIVHKGQLLIVFKYNPKETARLIHRYRIDMLGGVPGIYRSLLAAPGFTARRMKSLVRCYVFGDTVSSYLKKEFDSRVDPSGNRRVLFEAYSLSEFALGGPAEKEATSDRLTSTGKAQPGSQVALLREGKIHETGEGELLLAGDTMMLGYLNDEDIESTYMNEANTRWLRTGDYGRIDDDGYVYFLGRIKNIIIRNGYNVFPSELEELFQKTPGVKEVCVVGVYDPQMDTQQIAVCAAIDGSVSAELIKKQIMDTAGRHLPAYAIPNRVELLDSIPRNGSGKIDRAQLIRQLEGASSH